MENKQLRNLLNPNTENELNNNEHSFLPSDMIDNFLSSFYDLSILQQYAFSNFFPYLILNFKYI